MGFDIGGFIGDMAGGLIGNLFADERQQDQQTFNADQAARARSFEADMSNTRYQRTVADLKAAGLNPMLAYSQGGGPLPSAPAGASGIATPVPMHSVTAGQQSAAMASLAAKQEASIDAQIDKTKAEADEIRARTPTYAVSIDTMRQQIEESTHRITNLIQQTKTSAASAGEIAQRTENLRATLPQIEATVQQLKTLAALNVAQIGTQGAQQTQLRALAGLTASQQAEVVQRVRENLPKAEAALKELQRQAALLDQPRKYQEASVNEGYMGALSATLRALNPFNNFLK